MEKRFGYYSRLLLSRKSGAIYGSRLGAFPSSARATTYLTNQQGEIVKSDKSPSQIRNFEIADWTRLSEVQSEISDLGFKMQDSPISKFPRIGAWLVKYVDALCEEGTYRPRSAMPYSSTVSIIFVGAVPAVDALSSSVR